MKPGSECAPGRIVTGAEYVAQITAVKSDLSARAAFRNLVLAIAPAGGTLFDFGSGTGMDARFYAGRGFSVGAYDVDPQMCEYFAQQCRDLIGTGQVTLRRESYPEFLLGKGAASGGIDLVTSNFAPLNLIGNLHELFARFHTLTGPHGQVLASVLSPYFVGDLQYRWWWRNVLRLWREGRYSVPGAQAPIVRRRLADFAAQSAPYFRLARVFRGLPPVWGRYAPSLDRNAAGTHAWLRAVGSRFMFLLFEKQP